eukprot:m51a1_g218 hypothetical protein (306) ;mRNA; f:39943-41278
MQCCWVEVASDNPLFSDSLIHVRLGAPFAWLAQHSSEIHVAGSLVTCTGCPSTTAVVRPLLLVFSTGPYVLHYCEALHSWSPAAAQASQAAALRIAVSVRGATLCHGDIPLELPRKVPCVDEPPEPAEAPADPEAPPELHPVAAAVLPLAFTPAVSPPPGSEVLVAQVPAAAEGLTVIATGSVPPEAASAESAASTPGAQQLQQQQQQHEEEQGLLLQEPAKKRRRGRPPGTKLSAEAREKMRRALNETRRRKKEEKERAMIDGLFGHAPDLTTFASPPQGTQGQQQQGQQGQQDQQADDVPWQL